MRKVFLIVATVTVAMMAGCAPKQLTREEFLALNDATTKAMTREYSGVDKERLLTACEQALKASDSKYDVTQHMPNGFYAERRWLIYMVIAAATGKNHWKILVEENDGTTKAVVRSWIGDGMGANPFPVPFPGKTENEYYTSPSLYTLFFDRVDYFLGLREDWETCEAAEKKMHPLEAGIGAGLESLCSVARENDPTKPKVQP